MFKSEEQIEVFTNHLERFIKAVMIGSDDVTYLNRSRESFEAFIKIVCGITEVSNADPDTLLCPDCNGEMALRTNRTNGQKFWGCKKYPNCRGTRDENGLSREEREAQKQKKEEVAQEGGFSFNKGKRDPVNEVAPPPPPVKEWYNPFAK